MIFTNKNTTPGSFTISRLSIGMDNFCKQTRYFSTGRLEKFGVSHTIDIFFGNEKNQVYAPDWAMK